MGDLLKDLKLGGGEGQGTVMTALRHGFLHSDADDDYRGGKDEGS